MQSWRRVQLLGFFVALTLFLYFARALLLSAPPTTYVAPLCDHQHETINFESPAPNSLTGPRTTPLKLGTKSIVAIPVGKNSKTNVDKLVKAFGLDHFTFMLFHYDMTDWSDMPWYSQVISIRFPGHMKWWYMKRFVPPQVANAYEYVFAIDEDSDPSRINIPKFIQILRQHNISIAQPALSLDSGSINHEVTKQQTHDDTSIVGRWTDFVECGPFVAITSLAWRTCVWDFIPEDLTSGWGLDLLWHHRCRQLMHYDDISAVIDKYPQIHLSFRTASAEGKPGPIFKPEIEMNTYFDRYPDVPRTTMKTLGIIKE